MNKLNLTELSHVLTGTVMKRLGPCGKEGCKCAKSRKYWHGPYYIWTRKENGKTITKSLNPEQTKMCKSAIRNMRKLKKEIENLKKMTINALENIGVEK